MTSPAEGISVAAASLLRGPVYAEDNPKAWNAIRTSPGPLRDVLSVLGMRLVVDEALEFAYLRMLDELPDGMPRLFRRHQLTYHCTVLLVLLRQRMTQAEADEATPRLIVTGAQLVEDMRLYHREGTPEEKIALDIGRLESLGYLRKLVGQEDTYEARRVIKAVVTAEWLEEFGARLLAAPDEETVP